MIEQTNNTVVTRFAPSPTGLFQVGGVRSALFSYLYARQHGGKFILRCEDTDPVRSKKEYEEYFLEVFTWLGLEYDEYYRQSERGAIYKKYIDKLIAGGKAYVSKEEPKNEGDRAEVIRFKNPNSVITFHDEILGDISVDTTDLGDFVIARDFTSPLYHLTVVIDDHEMGVTHVIRGKEHVANTPRQILIQEAIGARRPVYAHLPLILSTERKKLSKRDPNVTPTLSYRDNGYLPGALLNFMALIGWNPGGEQEVYSKEELVQLFSLDRIQKSDGVFNAEKLEWLNKEHIKLMDASERMIKIVEYLPSRVKGLVGYSTQIVHKVAPVLIEHITNFGEIAVMADAGELDFYFVAPEYAHEKLFWKTESDVSQLKKRLTEVFRILSGLDEASFTSTEVKTAVWGYAEKEGRGQVLWPMRFALSGRDKSPDPFQLAEIIGKSETIKRIEHAITVCSE